MFLYNPRFIIFDSIVCLVVPWETLDDLHFRYLISGFSFKKAIIYVSVTNYAFVNTKIILLF